MKEFDPRKAKTLADLFTHGYGPSSREYRELRRRLSAPDPSLRGPSERQGISRQKGKRRHVSKNTITGARLTA